MPEKERCFHSVKTVKIMNDEQGILKLPWIPPPRFVCSRTGKSTPPLAGLPTCSRRKRKVRYDKVWLECSFINAKSPPTGLCLHEAERLTKRKWYQRFMVSQPAVENNFYQRKVR